MQDTAEPQLLFNYVGRLDLRGTTQEPWSLLSGAEIDDVARRSRARSTTAFRLEHERAGGCHPGGLGADQQLLWSDALFVGPDIECLTDFWQRAIAVLATGLDSNSTEKQA